MGGGAHKKGVVGGVGAVYAGPDGGAAEGGLSSTALSVLPASTKVTWRSLLEALTLRPPVCLRMPLRLGGSLLSLSRSSLRSPSYSQSFSRDSCV